MKPSLRGVIEWSILIATGFCGYNLSIIPLGSTMLVTICGVLMFGLGFIIHAISHKYHKKSHSTTDKIERIITRGIYSKIRHPGYLGIILTYIGFSLWWNSALPIIVALLFSALLIMTALKEEELLIRKFGEKYREYMKKVRWRFIPGIC